MRLVVCLVVHFILISGSAVADTAVDSFCHRIDRKLSSVKRLECESIGLTANGGVSVEQTPLFYKDFVPAGEPAGRVLLIGGIHGDEYSSISVVFKWLTMLASGAGRDYHWRVVPVLNPDGLLRPPDQSQRMNANGVDLNRNFPTPNWEVDAKEYWEKTTRYNKRRYPGPGPSSEPETSFVVDQLDGFAPDAVISVHAPHGVVDYDGPKEPPENLGPLDLLRLGTYPGSMGRYVGVHKGIPLLTVELQSATSMPKYHDLKDIWLDTVNWLDQNVQVSEAAQVDTRQLRNETR